MQVVDYRTTKFVMVPKFIFVKVRETENLCI